MSSSDISTQGATSSGGDDPVGYAAALAELDTILRELEASDVDVDRLADRVSRAAVLIAFCRDRIGGAKLQIESVVAGLTPAEDEE